jgi:hypothetical protein
MVGKELTTSAAEDRGAWIFAGVPFAWGVSALVG